MFIRSRLGNINTDNMTIETNDYCRRGFEWIDLSFLWGRSAGGKH